MAVLRSLDRSPYVRPRPRPTPPHPTPPRADRRLRQLVLEVPAPVAVHALGFHHTTTHRQTTMPAPHLEPLHHRQVVSRASYIVSRRRWPVPRESNGRGGSNRSREPFGPLGATNKAWMGAISIVGPRGWHDGSWPAWVVTVGACSWLSTADRGGPLPASHPCAETSMWHSVPLPCPTTAVSRSPGHWARGRTCSPCRGATQPWTAGRAWPGG